MTYGLGSACTSGPVRAEGEPEVDAKNGLVESYCRPHVHRQPQWIESRTRKPLYRPIQSMGRDMGHRPAGFWKR